MKKYGLMIIAAGSLLSGCMTTPPMISEATLAEISNPEKQGIAIQFGPNIVCPYMEVRLRNLETYNSYTASAYPGRLNGDKDSGSKVDIISVPAGRYQFVSGKCQSSIVVNSSNGGYIQSYAGMSRWFEPFDVVSGAITYPGSINLHWISLKTKGMLSVIPEWIMRAPRDHYAAYSRVDNSAVVKAEVEALVPNANFVTRISETKLNADIVSDIIQEAYLSIEEGTKSKRPNSKQAKKLTNAWLSHYQSTKTFDKTGPKEQEMLKAALQEDYTKLRTLTPRLPISDEERQALKKYLLRYIKNSQSELLKRQGLILKELEKREETKSSTKD